MDAVEFRMKNLSQPGDVAISGPTLTCCGVAECCEKAAEAIGWGRELPPGHGIGIACGTHFTSGKFHPNVNADFCAAGVKVNEDGSVSLMIGATEIGTGAATTATAMICAEELGIDLDDVDVICSDSETIPADFGTYGVARDDAVRQRGPRRLRAGARAAVPGRVRGAGGAGRPARAAPTTPCARATTTRSRWTSRRSCSRRLFRDRDGRQIMAQSHYDAPCSLPDPETGVGDFAMSYSFGAHAVEVEVDEETGHVRIVDFVAATDCGNLVNPALAESQVEGGAAQGIGYGLMEDLIVEEGQVMNPRFSTYRIPTATEMPPIRSLWVETNDPRGPYGAKGLGEMGLVPTAAAIANAVKNATGARITRIPLTPERVHSALGSNGGEA